MWSRTWRFAGSLQFLLVTAGLFAQDGDSAVVNFRPTGFRIGADLIPIVKSLTDSEFSGWELAADVDFHRYFLVAEAGSTAASETTADGKHETDGRFFRAGVDVNFLKNDPDRNAFFLGLRYGRSSFTENLQYQVQDPTWGYINQTVQIDQGSAGWMELVMGMKVKMWRGFWMGFTSRYKFGLSAEGSDQMSPYQVPGYGLAGRRSYWGFNYYAFYRIPFRK